MPRGQNQILLWMRLVRWSALLCLLFPAKSEAFKGQGSDFGNQNDAMIDQATTYYPEMGGSMEGGCAGGGTKPMNPCKHLLDDFVNGKVTDCVVAATQRSGGSASLYGCKAEAPFVSQAVGKAVIICFADIYASSESVGRTGVNGKRNPAKFDVATKPNSAMAKRVGAAGGGRVTCNGRLPETQPNERKPERNEEAKKNDPPPGGGSPAGGGGSPSGGGSPPPSGPQAQYPEAKQPPKSKDKPQPASQLPTYRVSRPDPLPETKPPDVKPSKGPSDITKTGGAPFSAGGIPPGEVKEPKRDPASNKPSGGGNVFASSGAPGGGSGGGFSSSGGGGGSGPFESSGAGSRSSSGGSASSGGGGGGSGGGGGADVQSPFGKVEVPKGPAAIGAGGAMDPLGAAAGPGEEPSGVGEMESDSLFARVHAYYVKLQKAGAR